MTTAIHYKSWWILVVLLKNNIYTLLACVNFLKRNVNCDWVFNDHFKFSIYWIQISSVYRNFENNKKQRPLFYFVYCVTNRCNANIQKRMVLTWLEEIGIDKQVRRKWTNFVQIYLDCFTENNRTLSFVCWILSTQLVHELVLIKYSHANIKHYHYLYEIW